MEFKVIDESNDHKYFTIVPNYVLNHSSANAQALYLQLKRLAGDNGIAYPSMDYLCKKLSLSKPTIRKEIQYLIDHKWIEYITDVPVETRGGVQTIKGYKVLDIWQINAEFYKGGKNKTALVEPKGGKNKSQRGEKISPLIRINIKEEHKEDIIINPKKYSSLKDITELDLQEISEKYKVSLGFVKLQLEKLTNYCEAKGRVYKNYKSALRNFVLGDMQKQVERSANDKYRPVDARNVK